MKISKMKSSLNQILKWNGWFFLLFAVVLFSSCEEDRVTFNQAQPEGVDPDAVLKKTFQGTFSVKPIPPGFMCMRRKYG